MPRASFFIGLVILSGFLLLTGCNTTNPESNNPTIQGYVTNDTGQRVAGAAILLCYDLSPPSPANAKPSTRIRFDLPETAGIRLWITEKCQGETVRELVDEGLDAGAHIITWDGRDDDGHKVVEGIYLYHLAQDGMEIASREMFLAHGTYIGQTSTSDLNYFAITDPRGYFTFPLDCLAFGEKIQRFDEVGTPLGEYTIPHRATIWAIHPQYVASASLVNLEINPNGPTLANITFAPNPAGNYADAHWSETQLACAYNPACLNQELAGIGQWYFPDIEDYLDLPLWVAREEDEAEFLANIGTWNQFVFGWDDFQHP
ncbi:MAG: FlgD immunoglobulin-like domain containing protein [bacterium]